eukprot:tig00021036_g17366.t1
MSRRVEDHAADLRRVLQRLDEANVRLKSTKCRFAKAEVELLGHIVDKNGIRMDPKKIEQIVKWPVPTNPKQLRAFYGFASYYRRFIKNFAKICEPSTGLLRSGIDWTWGKEQQSAFEELRRKLTEAPVLRYPDFEKKFILQTDACKYGLGAVLKQKDDQGNEYIVACASRSTGRDEKNYSVPELEALAVVWAVTDVYRPYLELRPFTLRTDHEPLKTFLKPTYELNGAKGGRITRWVMKLSKFQFDVEYIKGKTNLDADALSRLWILYYGQRDVGTQTEGSTAQIQISAVREFKQTAAEERALACKIIAALQEKRAAKTGTKAGSPPTLQQLAKEAHIAKLAAGGDKRAIERILSKEQLRAGDPSAKTARPAVAAMRMSYLYDRGVRKLPALEHAKMVEEIRAAVARLHPKSKVSCLGFEATCKRVAAHLKKDLFGDDVVNRTWFRRIVRDVIGNCRICAAARDQRQQQRAPRVAAVAPAPAMQAADSKMRDAQYADADLRRIIDAIREPASLDKLKRADREKVETALQYCALGAGGMLVKTLDRKGRPRNIPQVYVPKELREEIIKEAHAGYGGGHFGSQRTTTRIKERFFWPYMRKYVQHFIKGCEVCRTTKHLQTTHVPPEARFASRPMQRWQLDVVEFAGKDAPQLLTMEDSFSRLLYADVYARVNSEAVKKSLQKLFNIHGLMLEVEVDQGTPFVSADTASFLKKKGVRLVILPAYVHQTKGKLERAHHTLEAIIRSLTAQRGGRWQNHVQEALTAYNTSVSAATGFSPFRLHHGYDAVTELDLKYSAPVTTAPGTAPMPPIQQVQLFGERIVCCAAPDQLWTYKEDGGRWERTAGSPRAPSCLWRHGQSAGGDCRCAVCADLRERTKVKAARAGAPSPAEVALPAPVVHNGACQCFECLRERENEAVASRAPRIVIAEDRIIEHRASLVATMRSQLRSNLGPAWNTPASRRLPKFILQRDAESASASASSPASPPAGNAPEGTDLPLASNADRLRSASPSMYGIWASAISEAQRADWQRAFEATLKQALRIERAFVARGGAARRYFEVGDPVQILVEPLRTKAPVPNSSGFSGPYWITEVLSRTRVMVKPDTSDPRVVHRAGGGPFEVHVARLRLFPTEALRRP